MQSKKVNPFKPSRCILLVAALIASGLARDARALEMGADGCLPPDQLMSRLEAEGQYSVLFGDRLYSETGNRAAGTVFAVFTKNKTGSKGYAFEGDKPTGEKSTKFCLSGTFDRAFALDSAVAKVPPGIADDSSLVKTINYFIVERGWTPLYIGERSGAITVIVGNPKLERALNGIQLIGNNDPKRQSTDIGFYMGLKYSPNFDGIFINSSGRKLP